jgi:adenylosuccinate lyase
MISSALNAISPVDGRYHLKTQALSPYFSEFGLTYFRLMIEIRWFESLAANQNIHEILPLNASTREYLNDLLKHFDETEAQAIKAYEQQTNHDVKAVEYYLKDKL